MPKRFNGPSLHRPERDLAIHEVLRAIAGLPAAQISRRTYVHASTINKWRSARTRYPQHHTLNAVAKTAGLEFRLIRIGVGKAHGH